MPVPAPAPDSIASGAFALAAAACTNGPVAGFHNDVSADPATFKLLGAPLIYAPTASGFAINVALRAGDPRELRARVRDQADPDWTDVGRATSPASDIAQWSVSGLAPGRSYEVEIRVHAAQPFDDGPHRLLYTGRALTAPAAGTPFSFALISDSHIPPREPLPEPTDVSDYIEATLATVAADIHAVDPDFVMNLGDVLDFHMFGFNDPPPDGNWTRLGYLNYRRLLGDTLQRAAHFPVVGNWDGETGCFTQEEIERSRSQRLLYLPGPGADTTAEGGSPNAGLLRVHVGRRAVRRPQRHDVHADVPQAGRQARPARRLDAGRGAAGVAGSDAGCRHVEVALPVHSPHGRRRGGRLRRTLLTAAAADRPPTSASRRWSTT